MKRTIPAIPRALSRLLRGLGEMSARPIGQLRGPSRLLGLTAFSGVLLVLVGVGLVVLAMALSWGNVALASRPSSCQLCHEMQPAHQQWLASTHKGIGCLNCHVEPNLAGYVKINVSAVTNTVKHFTGDYEMPVPAQVQDSSCLKCHPKGSRPEELPQASLRIAHSLHEQQQCADCHGRLVHKNTVDVPTPTPLLASASPVVPTLAKSHAPKDCQVCHPSPQPEYVHGSASLACTSCHSATIPRHELAVSQGVMARESCQECHTRLRVVGSPQECQRCHVSPHGIDQRVDLQCTLCHSSADTWAAVQVNHPLELSGKHGEVACSQCHSPTRPVTQTAGKGVDCARCHQPGHAPMGTTTCSTCHSPKGWKAKK